MRVDLSLRDQHRSSHRGRKRNPSLELESSLAPFLHQFDYFAECNVWSDDKHQRKGAEEKTIRRQRSKEKEEEEAGTHLQIFPENQSVYSTHFKSFQCVSKTKHILAWRKNKRKQWSITRPMGKRKSNQCPERSHWRIWREAFSHEWTWRSSAPRMTIQSLG